ncbi:MAG TPA: SMP-30/gluconolactonase/LRE family protein [Bryobacteraceae bacterium]
MNLSLMFAGAAVAALAPLASSQAIQRLDSAAANRIIPQGAKVEAVATHLSKWTEGPVWARNGSLFFAEIPENRIAEWTPGRGVSVFIHPSGYTGGAPYNGPEPGSNGMTLDSDGRLTVAGHARRNVWRLESLSPSAQITVLADSYKGKKFNSPNDLVYKSDGSLYFTDPPYGLRTQSDKDPDKQLSFNGVYRIPNARQQKAGAPPARDKLQLLIKDMPRPNGIAFSPDEKYLYVSDSERQLWMRYKVAADGSVSDGSVFCDAKGQQGVGGPDGIKVDKQGNVYGAGPGGVWIISPEGKHIATIGVPERVGNVAWGNDGKTLYITATSGIYRIRLNAAGAVPGQQ